MHQLFHSFVIALAVSLLYQVNTTFFQVFMELIDAYEPLSQDSSHPNVMRIVWHVILFGCVLVLALLILALHPLSRKILLVNYNEKETININYPLQNHHHQKKNRRQEKKADGQQQSSETESETD